MTGKQHDRHRALTDPNRQTDLDQMNTHLPEQSVQPEEGSPRADERQVRGRSDGGSDRAQQNAGDDVGEAAEEA